MSGKPREIAIALRVVGVGVGVVVGGLVALLSLGCSDAPDRRAEAADAATTPIDALALDDELLARLEAIGYAAAGEAAAPRTGVVRHDPERADPGPVLYVSGHAPEAFLIDVAGRELHRWHADADRIWPNELGARLQSTRNFFRRAYLQPDGTLLVIFEGYGLALLGPDSRVRWERLNLAHHAAQMLPDGSVYVLTRQARAEPAIDPERRVIVDFVSELGPDGSTRRRVSVLGALLASEYAALAREPHPDLPPRGLETLAQGDLHHTNALSVLERDHPTVPGLRAGHLLLSSAHLSAIFALDLEAERVTWLHRGDFLVQHEPTLLESGNILLFDNNTRERGSRLIEIDPASGEIVWQFPQPGAPERFFSDCCGTCSRLPNGNTFAALTGPGRIVEIAPGGDVVWEFRTPHRAGAGAERVAAVFDAAKLPVDYPLGWARGRR